MRQPREDVHLDRDASFLQDSAIYETIIAKRVESTNEKIRVCQILMTARVQNGRIEMGG